MATPSRRSTKSPLAPRALRSRGGTLPSALALCAIIGWTLVPLVAAAQDRWTTPFPGVRYLDRRAPGPRRIFAAVIDLCAAGVRVRATAESEHHRTVPSYASLVGADVAINADFYNTSTFEPTSPAAHAGVSWGATDTRSTGFLAFGVDRVHLSPPSEVLAPLPAWMLEVVGGRPRIVEDGEPVLYPGSDLCTARHPRTMAGFSRDRRTLILAVVDGRSSASIGMTCAEESALLIELGADVGMNLDGGGSSTMWLRGPGVVNDPSDGTPRSVSNHLAVFADGSGAPMACQPYEPYELASSLTALSGTRSTDVDGDGRADACVRAAAGIRCATSNGTAFAPAFAGPTLSDASGWSDPTNYRTIVMGDVTGDGLSDLCARAGAGVRCWPSTGTGFDDAIVGPALSDDTSWDEPRYHATLGLNDVDGDGRFDLCARAGAGIRCWRSTGEAFEPWGAAAGAFSNEAGFGANERWATIRYLDLDGDGLGDVCGRGRGGVICVRSNGSGWDETSIAGPAWTDAAGFGVAHRDGTILAADVDFDGRDDLCARNGTGLTCAFWDEGGLATATLDAFADASGWTDVSNWETVRLADVDGDHDLDVCGRADDGVRCFLFDGATRTFAGRVDGPALSDESGWSRARYFRTLRFADVDGDGDDDLCARAAAGVQCWPAQPGGFGGRFDGPTWGDEQGFWAERYHETIRLASLRARPEPPAPDAGVSVADGGPSAPDAGPSRGDASTTRDAGAPRDPMVSSGCACRAGRGASGTPLSALALLVALLARRR